MKIILIIIILWSLTLSTNSLFSYEVENPPLLSESYEQEKLDIFVEDQLTSIEKLSKKIDEFETFL